MATLVLPTVNDCPEPKPRLRELTNWAARMPLTLRGADALLPQRNNYRWPLELGNQRAYPNDLRTWTRRHFTALIETPLPQRNVYKWPLEPGPARAYQNDLRTETQGRLNPALIDTPLPQRNQYDNPNPRGPYRANATWINQ